MYTVYIINNEAGGGFDVSSLVHDITYTTTLYGQPGKLTFQLERDPGGLLSISNGNMVVFTDGDNAVFKGYVFTVGTDRTEVYNVVAYDSSRYLQNHDYFNLNGNVPQSHKTLSEVFSSICSSLGIETSILVPATEVLNSHLFIDESYFDILQHCIDETNLKTEKMYFIRDRFGKMELNEVEANYLKMFGMNPLVIGDDSLLTDYKYEVDIDKDTYNEVYMLESIKSNSENDNKEKTNKRIVSAKQLESSIKKWGVLRKIVNVKEQATQEQLDEYARLTLSMGAKSSKTMRVEAIGYPVYAGDGFRLCLSKLGVNKDVYIMSATHNYGTAHTMTLDVSTNSFMPETL